MSDLNETPFTTSFEMGVGGFTVSDYVVFGVLLTASCIGGIWYGYTGSRTTAIKDIKDYLLGGRTMSTFPVAMSLIASYVSGVTILGTPAETYNYGIQYWLILVSVTLSSVIVGIVYVPVFCSLKVSSSYEYLELRFNRHVRAIASILFLLDEVLFLPLVIYVPALAFNQLTGVNVLLICCIMVVICGLYTALGGLRAVVWTDSVQVGVMFLGVLIVTAAGTVALGGFRPIMEVARQNSRLDLSNWSFSLYERHTGWGVLIGGTMYWTAFNSCNQTMVQRYLALHTAKKARSALALFSMGAILAISLCVWCGLLAWAAWFTTGCDPAGAPLAADSLLPAFVTYIANLQKLHGLAGVFLAGVFGAGLSSLSAVLNACALVALEDIVRGWMKKRLKPFTEGVIARCITAALAVISIIMVYVVSKLGGVLGVATALSAIAASTTCGIFTLGMVCPWVGPRGAIIGGVAGALVAGTLSVGTQVAAGHGLRQRPPPFDAECALNASYVPPSSFDPETVFPPFRISFHWIAPMGLTTVILVGAIMGWLLDASETLYKDTQLFTPVIWRWLPDEYHQNHGERRRALQEAIGAAGEPPSAPLILGKMDNKGAVAGSSSSPNS